MDNQCNKTTNRQTDGDSLREVKLDVDKLQEFSNMSVWPHVKEVIQDLITKLLKGAASLKKDYEKVSKLKPK